MLIAPTASTVFSAVVTPLTLICIGGFYISLTLHIDDALDSLNEIETAIQFPDWLDDCFDSPVTDSINTARSFVLINEMREEMDYMRTLMFCFLIALAVLLGLPIFFAFLFGCCSAVGFQNDYNFPKDAGQFLKAYILFN